MNSRLLKRVFLISLLAVSVNATSYYVSPTGNDANSGLSEATAWASIDRGDILGVVLAGDSVWVTSGTYSVSNTIKLNQGGNNSSIIVYARLGMAPAVIDFGNSALDGIVIVKSHVAIRGLTVANVGRDGIVTQGANIEISDCTIHHAGQVGLRVSGGSSSLIRNTIFATTGSGILIESNVPGTSIYGNTIHGCAGVGIALGFKASRVFNNIIASSSHGISGVVVNICGFNLLWNNSAGDYFGGAVDSGGGIAADPMFVDTASADYRLGFGSPAIDAGLDVGYSFSGSAPDMGAYETGKLDHLEIVPIRDTLSADSSYQFSVVAYDSANNPATAGLLTWSHTFATGSIDSAGLFTPVGIGAGTISVASSINGVTAQTAPIYVREGAPIAMAVAPLTMTIQAGDSQLFSVSGIDKNANVVSDLGVITWGVAGSIGTIDSTGAFVAGQTGFGAITAVSTLGLSATSDTIEVVPGPLASISVLPSTNVVQTLQTYQYSALGYDALSNFIADFTDSMTWSTTDPVGNISISGLYTAGAVGSFWVKGQYSGFGDSGAVDVTLSGGLDHISIEFFDGTPVGDLSLTTDDDTTRLYARGYSSSNALIGDVSVDWGYSGPQLVGKVTPNIGEFTVLSLKQTGIIRVGAQHANGFTDSTGVITVSAGTPTTLRISPNTADLQSGDTLQFSAVSRDADNCVVDSLPLLVWDVSGGIGTIDAGGLFTAQYSGIGRIVATSGGLVDTSDQISVVAGPLASIRVEPDSVTARIGDTIQYLAIGLDNAGNTTDPGIVLWKSYGRLGTIDSTGKYIATAPGIGAVSVLNQLAGIADTTGGLRIEELYFTTIPIGNNSIHPDGHESPVAAFRIDNYFTAPKTVTAISIRDLSTGAGNAAQLASNILAARVYLDIDGDSTLSVLDSLLAESAYTQASITFPIPPVTFNADSGRTFIVTVISAAIARDGDTVDVVLIPGVDIETADLTVVSGPPLSNSMGVTQIDGMVASQVSILPIGSQILRAVDSLHLCMTLDLPRNGYAVDTLNSITIVNYGTASENDFDSLVLFADDGDNLWSGSSTELSLGRMAFNGESWSRGGIAAPLLDSTTRLFVATKLNRFPNDRATIIFGLPVDGARVSSGNDGPIDLALQSPDTLTIEGRQAIVATLSPITARSCIPGETTGPLLAVRLTNGYTQSIAVESLRFAYVGTDAVGPNALQSQAQIDSVYLYADRDGNANSISVDDSLIATSHILNGIASFDVNALAIAGNGGTSTIVVAASLGLYSSKNGNIIGFALEDSSALVFDRAVKISGVFPYQNPASFTINAFPAEAVVMHALPAGNLYAGQVDRPVLDFEIPRNGYAADKLVRIDLVNSGTISDDVVLANVRLWKDVSGNGFSIDDAPVGEFKYTGDGWRIQNIASALDLPLNRFIATVSVSGNQFDGGTLRFDLPASAVLNASGTTGPDNLAITNQSTFLVFPSNRVTAISIPLAPIAVTPGSADHVLMTYALYNGYVGQTKTLNQVTLTNSSHSVGSTTFSDQELGQVSLVLDANKNRILDQDQVIGTGRFSSGVLRFEGFATTLPPESLAYFFVTADLPTDLIDNDSLSVSVEQATDFSFVEFVNVNGDLPLSSGRHLIVDGSVRRQYGNYGPFGRSLSPGDTDIVFMAFSPAHNGDQQDILNNLVVGNVGTADTSSIANLRLWHDVDANYQRSAGDTVLNTFAYSAGAWSIANLGLPISASVPHLLIVGNVAATAPTNATIQLAVPLLGCNYLSGNDGPRDSALVASGSFTVSTSSLEVSLGLLGSSYSVGQTIDVALSITNATAGSIDSVYGMLDDIQNPSLVRLDSSLNGPATLSAGQQFISHYYFTALAEGSQVWQLRASSKVPVDSSATIQTAAVQIQSAISPVSPQLVNTSPTAVTKGQTNIFPMTLWCAHPDTGRNVAAMTLQSLRVRVVDGQGLAIPANTVFSRMMIETGFDILSVVTSVPSQSDVSFPFDDPVIIGSGESQNFMLVANIASSASAPGFRVSIDSASWVPLIDGNTGQIIPTALTTTYPLQSASTRVDAPSQQIAVSAVSCSLPTVNFGQQDVASLKVLVRHGGQPGSSPVQITRLSLDVIDSLGGGLFASDLFSRVSLWRQSYMIGEVTPSPVDSSAVDISLSTPLNLSPEEIDSIVVAVSVRTSVTSSGFSLRIADSSCFTVRDLNTGSALQAVSDSALATGNAFPMVSQWSSFRMPAGSPSVCLTDLAPTSIAGGADSVQLLSITATYPLSNQYSSPRLSKATIRIVDGDGGVVDPNQLFDRIGIRVNGGAIQYNQMMSIFGNGLNVSLTDGGLILAAGDSISLALIGDLRLEAPYSSFAIRLLGLTDFESNDMSDPSRMVGAVSIPGCTQTYPFSTATTSILLPAGRPIATRSVSPVRIASVGSQRVVIFDGTVSYNSPSPLGQIEIRGMSATLSRGNHDVSSVSPVSASASQIHLEINGAIAGTDSVLAGNMLAITITNPITLGRGESVDVRVTCDLPQTSEPGNILMTFSDSTFLSIVDKSLLTPVYPILSGALYPVEAGEISIVAADLTTSFTNYPNPFNPARGEATTIGFVLDENATVDIEIFTVTGEPVFKVTSQSPRTAGPHQSDSWSGQNGNGRNVIPGVYFCRIAVNYESGRVETIRRKIAVVR
jgi:Right handed beta helix region